LITAKTDTVSGHNAWLLDFGQELYAAVGARVLLQVIDRPELNAVPCSPDYCSNVFKWHNRLLPVMDMATRISRKKQQSRRLLAVAGFQYQPGGATRFVGLTIETPPLAITVGDDQAMVLTANHALNWGGLALSCIEHNGKTVPILNLDQIFAQPTN